jgi:hypothetical protein
MWDLILSGVLAGIEADCAPFVEGVAVSEMATPLTPFVIPFAVGDMVEEDIQLKTEEFARRWQWRINKTVTCISQVEKDRIGYMNIPNALTINAEPRL